MTDQNIDQFLADHGWQTAQRQPIAGDMSSRRYFRLIEANRQAVLMQADSPMHAFVAISAWLQTIGLSSPQIMADEAERGLLLLEDFGNLSARNIIEGTPEKADEIFDLCQQALSQIRQAPTPQLDQPDATTLADWTKLADHHYPGINADQLGPFRQVLLRQLAELLAAGVSVSLRDFHSDNLMWLPDRVGVRRLGLLDFQDAFLTHPVYDLVSMLTDARTQIPRPLREAQIQKYAELNGDDPEDLKRAFSVFSAQRNLRILGIFHRGQRHLGCLPRVYGYFAEALEHPVFDNVRAETLASIPAPENVQ